MKTMLFIFVIASSVIAQRPATQSTRELLFDFRKDIPANAVKISAAAQRNVLSKVFRRYLTDQDKCRSDFAGSDGNDYLAAARKAGQIVPSIIDMTTGSFTATGQTQTAYVISVSECNASHADNFGTKRIAIFSGPQLVAEMDADFMGIIVRKTDLDGNGIDELLMISSDMAQGTVTEMATLASFENGRRRVIHDFATVVLDSCASEAPGSDSKAAVLYTSAFAPGLKPTFTQENYVASCRNPHRWRLVSKGKIIE
ncbi:MAG TPA: hypothetical protein VHS05_18105 [Pyrinomonadaceae bacterium]|nr:hypothetical protein [Pyrinomonadaceae bacterium]